MRTLLRAAIALAALAILDGAPTALAQDWIADIRAVPQRHVNREVTVEGQVMAATPNPAGTTRGTYMLVDDSDPTGIAIRTRDLPAPGREFSVSGTVIQDPQTGAFLIDEISRAPVGRPGWLLPTLIGLGIAVVLLGWALVRSLRGTDEPEGMTDRGYAHAGATVRPGTARGAAPTIHPGGAASGGGFPPRHDASGSAPTAARPAPKSDATEVLEAGEATEVFRSLGASFHVTEGPDAGKSFPIGKTVVLIGRRGRRGNDITLTDTSISREQARLSYNEEADTFTLINESKTNPTRVDGTAVDAKELSEGAKIEMGRTTAVLERGE